MRTVFAIFALAMIVCGCSERCGQPPLQPLARGLSEAMRPAYGDFTLEISAIDNGNRVALRCVLKNVSVVATAIDVDASTLPCRNPEDFDINAVAANGDVVHRNPPPVEVAQIRALPSPLTIASGESIEDEMELGRMPIGALPRNKDLLLLWSTSLREFRSGNSQKLSGVTLLIARPKATAPVFTTTELKSSIGGTSVPTQQMKQDLRDAPETLVLDNTVIRLLVFPWENRMPMAVSRDPNTGLATPDRRPMHMSLRLISENGTPLPLTLRVQEIWIVQDSQIWNGSKIEETVGESNGSSRDFLIHDGPIWRSMTPVDVVLTLRDDKGSIHWLAERNQRIAAVE
jgi:hypothetical protein